MKVYYMYFFEKLAPNLYRAIIDEAHKNGMRVLVHATGLEDAKALLRAGVDVFGHMIGDMVAAGMTPLACPRRPRRECPTGPARAWGLHRTRARRPSSVSEPSSHRSTPWWSR